MKWIKLRDKIPKHEDYPIFLFYLESNSLEFEGEYKNKIYPVQDYIRDDLFWISALIPTLPEKQKHDCWNHSNCGTFYCYENNEGELILEHDFAFLSCKFCPFCGFTLDEK